ncbi:hypothetical protein OH768_53540 [Streptomyces sp. NBC_01622]|uniref:hypothetical protein n=1 Tax=Streptomyces sp. NBC_01622 TaxID=2975903 RepID=UPI00386D9F17|nr:hypothetical protein OH768_53540 [Streptomyces sp. NBC_01622]
MSNELRDAYVRALQTTEGTDPLSQLARASLQASATKFSGLGLQEAATGALASTSASPTPPMVD